MLYRPPSAARRAGTTVTTALLLVPLLALVAFAVDLNHVWRTDGEIQNAADSAALAGATRLLGLQPPGAQAGQAGRAALLEVVQALVAQRAVAFGQKHRGGDVDLALNATDVELGYIADPAARPDTPAGQFQTGPAAPFPN